MVFDYEDLLVIGVLFDLNLKKFLVWMIWERFFEILVEKLGVMSSLRHHVAWVN